MVSPFPARPPRLRRAATPRRRRRDQARSRRRAPRRTPPRLWDRTASPRPARAARARPPARAQRGADGPRSYRGTRCTRTRCETRLGSPRPPSQTLEGGAGRHPGRRPTCRRARRCRYGCARRTGTSGTSELSIRRRLGAVVRVFLRGATLVPDSVPSKYARIAVIADPELVEALERVRSATGSDEPDATLVRRLAVGGSECRIGVAHRTARGCRGAA